jgi:hypothetical protein
LQEYVVFSGSVDDIMGCTLYKKSWFNLEAVRIDGTDSMATGIWFSGESKQKFLCKFGALSFRGIERGQTREIWKLCRLFT